MDISRMIDSLKRHPEFYKMGMIASHLGIVRGTSLNGQGVTGIEVTYNQEKISNIINEIKKMNGIIEVLVETFDGLLEVGDEIMAVVIGGDTRDHVFPALAEAVNRIKAEATKKKEFFVT
jgi:molybdopterin synthase catalytic subunit